MKLHTNGQTLNNFSYKMSRTGRSIETEGSSATAKGGGGGQKGRSFNEYTVSFRDDENILELNSGDVS